MGTKLLADIAREPEELRGIVARLARSGVADAARILAGARDVVVTGIGSSWHAGMAVQAHLAAAGVAATLADASDLLHFAPLRPDQALLVLSRSGRSVEIVRLVERARASRTPIVAVTNTPGSPLAGGASAVVALGARFDHAISIAMYSGLGVAGALVADVVAGTWSDAVRSALDAGFAAAGASLDAWQARIAASRWAADARATYFLARGPSLASASETRLLWEEAAKAPATALTTGHFRHGPQEILGPDIRVCAWLDATRLRDEDRALVGEIAEHGARTALIGRDVADGDADLALAVPAMPDGWQFAVDCIPAQLMAEAHARARGVDSDAFRICPYVISGEGGLRAAGAG